MLCGIRHFRSWDSIFSGNESVYIVNRFTRRYIHYFQTTSRLCPKQGCYLLLTWDRNRADARGAPDCQCNGLGHSASTEWRSIPIRLTPLAIDTDTLNITWR